jgi:hypothetical protein
MMLLRPEGLFPSQRRRQELHIAEELSTGPDEPLPAEAAALAASPAPEPDPSSLPVGGSDVAGITDVDRGSPDTSEPGSGR